MRVLPPDLRNDQSNQTMMISVLLDWYISNIRYIVLRWAFKTENNFAKVSWGDVCSAMERSHGALNLHVSGRRLRCQRPLKVGGAGNWMREEILENVSLFKFICVLHLQLHENHDICVGVAGTLIIKAIQLCRNTCFAYWDEWNLESRWQQWVWFSGEVFS